MATKANNNVNGNVNVFDTVGNKVKTQVVEGNPYIVGKQKSDGIHLIKDDGKGLTGGNYTTCGSMLVEQDMPKPVPTKASKVSSMSADDKLAALNAKGKADGFVKMSNANGDGSIWKMIGGVPTPVEDKEIEKLLGMILDQDYILNMHISRSWILPQMKWMLFDPKSGRMDTRRYREQVKNRGINDAWDLLVHNLYKMCVIKNKDPKEFEIMALNWNSDLAMDMARNDLANAKAYVESLPTHTCSKFYPHHLPYVAISAMYGKGHTGKMYFTKKAEEMIDRYIAMNWNKKECMKTRAEQRFLSDLWQEFDKRIARIRMAGNNIERLYQAVKEYADNRIKYPMQRTERKTVTIRRYNGKSEQKLVESVVFTAKFPEQYMSAFKADGAYYTMRSLLRYYGEQIGVSKVARKMWLDRIEVRMEEYAGEGYKMFGFMVNEFLPAIRFTKASDFDRLKK